MSGDATELDRIRDLIDNFRHVKAQPAFQLWQQTVESQMRGRRDQAHGPVEVGTIGELNYRNGEGSGIQLAIQMWDLLTEQLEHDKVEALDKVRSEADDQQKEN